MVAVTAWLLHEQLNDGTLGEVREGIQSAFQILVLAHGFGSRARCVLAPTLSGLFMSVSKRL